MDQEINNINDVVVALRKDTSPPPSQWHKRYSHMLGKINGVEHKERNEIIPYQPMTGRYLKIWSKKRPTTLYLCEVEVIKADGKLFTYNTVIHYLRLYKMLYLNHATVDVTLTIKLISGIIGCLL